MTYPEELIFKIPCITVKNFADKHGVTTMAIYYAIRLNLIDTVVVGKHCTLVVLTPRTCEYVPHRHTMEA